MLRPLIVWLLIAGISGGHQIAEVTIGFHLDGDRVQATAEADAAYMLPEFRGDENEEAKDLAWLREQGPDGWQRIARECEAYWRDCLHLKADGRELAWSLRVAELEKEHPGFLDEGEPEDLPMLAVEIDTELPAGAQTLEVAWQEPFGVNLIATVGDSGATETFALVSGEQRVVAKRTAENGAMKPTDPTLSQWVKFGFVHILPKGLDHILFVFGLFLLVPKWKPLLQQTIVFTLAHSLSLAAAALGWVKLPAAPVEILIAASIAWVGIGNFRAKDLGKGRLVLVGVFGLVHGLGFAGVLAELLPADRPEKLPAALLGFNVGVELGQVAVLAIAFAAFGWWGKRFTWAKHGGSALVALGGLFLVAERVAELW